jgi:hypothetical protein
VVLDDFDAAEAIFVLARTRHQPPAHDERPAQGGTPGCQIVTFNNSKRWPWSASQAPEPGGATDPGGPPSATSTSRQSWAVTWRPFAAWRNTSWKRRGRIDLAFIEQHTAHFDDYLAQVKATEWTQIEAQSGLGRRRSPGRRRSSQAARA